jgi:hypothetical protein
MYACMIPNARMALRKDLPDTAPHERHRADGGAGPHSCHAEPESNPRIAVLQPSRGPRQASDRRCFRVRRGAEATDGAFDVTVGPLVGLWRAARRSARLPTAAALDSARALVGWRRVVRDSVRRRVRLATPGMRLDLGGIGKGYIVQQAVATLRAQGTASALVEAGGDRCGRRTSRGAGMACGGTDDRFSGATPDGGTHECGDRDVGAERAVRGGERQAILARGGSADRHRADECVARHGDRDGWRHRGRTGDGPHRARRRR